MTTTTAVVRGTRRRFLTRAAAVAALTVGAGLVSVPGASAATTAEEEDQFVTRINSERAKSGAAALKVCDGIRTVARNWSNEMARTGKFAHNPNYASQMPSGWTRAAENIAWGSGSYATVDSRHQALMNSAGHRANILDPAFTHIGVGVARTGDRMYVTQNFGRYPNGCGGTTPPPSTSYQLSVTRTGKGKVTSTPTGIACGRTCTASYAKGTSVKLTARPNNGRTFTGWGGACAGTNLTCTVTVNANTAVSATFK